MPVDIVVEMQRMWSGLQKDLDSLDAESSEQEIERYLDRVVVLRGVEIQTVYPDLQEVDDQADSATAAATAAVTVRRRLRITVSRPDGPGRSPGRLHGQRRAWRCPGACRPRSCPCPEPARP